MRCCPPLARALPTLLLCCAPALAARAQAPAAAQTAVVGQAPAAAKPAGAPSPALQRANALMTQQKHAEAAAAFQALVDADAADDAAWFGLGYCKHMLGDMPASLAAHERAARAPKFAVTAAYNAACACARLGRVDDAFAWLGRARAAGFVDWPMVAKDTDLDALRADARLAPYLPAAPDSTHPFVEDARVLHDLRGEAAGDQFGWVARALDDVDGDGALDFAVTAPYHGGGAGALYVHSGKSGALLLRVLGRPGEQLGWCVASAGDLDQDGRPDVVAGAPGSASVPGSARAFSGADGRQLAEWTGEAAGDSFGKEVRTVGDQDGDGVADFLIGAPNHDAAGADAGRVYLFSGKTRELVHAFDGERAGDNLGGGELAGFANGKDRLLVASALNAGAQNGGVLYAWSGMDTDFAPRFSFAGDGSSQNLGWFLSIVGDVDADGAPDVLATDWHDNQRGPLTGRAWVVSSVDGALLLDVAGEKAGGGFGVGEGRAGDLDRDGHDDLVLGAWQSSDGAPTGGKIVLVSGKDGSTLGTLTGRIAGDVLGFDATSLGDLDADGVPDLLVTSAYNAAKGPKAGRTYVVSGASCLAARKR